MGKFNSEHEEKYIKQFIAGDTSIYFEHVYPVLFKYACMSVNKYGRTYFLYAATKKDLVQELISHTAIALNKYNADRGANVFTFIQTVMKNEIYKKYHHATFQQRDARNTFSLQSIAKDDDEQENYILANLISAETNHDYYKDYEFLKFVVSFWRSFPFPTCRNGLKRVVYLVCDILENPENHPLGKNQNYSGYICEHQNISRQRVYQVFEFMRTYKKVILEKYERISEAKKVLKI